MYDFDQFSQADVERPRWVRRLNRVLLLICAGLMTVVLLSQPKIADLFNLSSHKVSTVSGPMPLEDAGKP